MKKHLGDVAKTKGKQPYGKMMEDLGLRKSTRFALDEISVFLIIWERLMGIKGSRSLIKLL